jgi:hypothetical protein
MALASVDTRREATLSRIRYMRLVLDTLEILIGSQECRGEALDDALRTADAAHETLTGASDGTHHMRLVDAIGLGAASGLPLETVGLVLGSGYGFKVDPYREAVKAWRDPAITQRELWNAVRAALRSTGIAPPTGASLRKMYERWRKVRGRPHAK